MSALRYADALRRIESGGAAGAWFLCGPETLLRDRILDRIKEELFGGPQGAAPRQRTGDGRAKRHGFTPMARSISSRRVCFPL